MTSNNNARGTLSDRGLAKRTQIVDVAARLFDEHGYAGVSVDDIAESAGIAKPTLYHYFRGKTEILFEIHRAFIFPLLERARMRAMTEMPASEELRLIIKDVLGFFAQKPGHMRVFSEHLRELRPEDRAVVTADRDEYRKIIELALERGQNSGEFMCADTRIAALTLLGAMNWAYHWFRSDGPQTAGDVADGIWRQLLLGLAPRGRGTTEGRELS